MKISSFESYLLKIPKEVNDICIQYEGWIVGGAARFVLDLEQTVKDWDILIPWNRWGEASLKIIPEKTPANSCGGFKLNLGNSEVDIWGGDVGWFLGNCSRKDKENYALNLSYETILKSSDF